MKMKAWIASVTTMCAHGEGVHLMFFLAPTAAEAAGAAARTACERHGNEHPLIIVKLMTQPIDDEQLRSAVEHLPPSVAL
jgi:hypothetical protein